jgi:hypothetical protein
MFFDQKMACTPYIPGLRHHFDDGIFSRPVATKSTTSDTAATGVFAHSVNMAADSSRAVPWADFWQQLEKTASGSKLDYTAFVYKAHDLHLPEQREKFQQAVASDSSTSSSTVLSRADFDNLLSLTSSRHLAELVDLAMNMGKPG